MRENRDRYLGFTYNGKSMNMTAEADFFGFIENSGNELSFFNTPEFTNEFVVPQFGEKTIYTGNTKSNKVFNLKIQLDKINLHKYREFLEWLSPDSQGILIFDYNPNYGYDVKLENVSQSEFHVVKRSNHNEDFYYIDLAIDFITVRDYAARWVKEGVFFPGGNLIESEFYEDFIEEVDEDTYKIYNYHNVKNYFTIEFDNTLAIQEPGETPTSLVSITGAGTGAKYLSEFGIALKADGTFLACGPNPLISLEAKTNRTLIITGTNIKIIPSSREIL
jgi:hypothetical protein